VHRLERSRLPEPPCLASRRQAADYARLTKAEKAEIRTALLALQADRCAYCERRTGDHQDYDGHIEHFRKQANHSDLDLKWDNLYWSCLDERTCGKHKDKCSAATGPRRIFDPADLLDPGCDDPEDYLRFTSDGSVAPRDGMGELATRRATETIRVFQLNEAACLKRSRRDAVHPFFEAVALLLENDPDLLRKYVDRQLRSCSDAHHGTAIKHFLMNVIS
jgi:uncharacterized protein (TIGR02646 family)